MLRDYTGVTGFVNVARLIFYKRLDKGSEADYTSPC